MRNTDRIEEFYKEYGRFIVRFECGCEIIRKEIGRLMGLNVSFWEDAIQIKDILLQGLTAGPLIEKLYAVYIFVNQNDTIGTPRLKRIKKLFLDLVEIRNTLSHGVVNFQDIFGVEDIEEDKMFRLKHHKIKSKGFDENLKLVSPEKLKSLSKNLDELYLCLTYLHSFKSSKIGSSEYSLIQDIDERLSKIEFNLN